MSASLVALFVQINFMHLVFLDIFAVLSFYFAIDKMNCNFNCPIGYFTIDFDKSIID